MLSKKSQDVARYDIRGFPVGEMPNSLHKQPLIARLEVALEPLRF